MVKLDIGVISKEDGIVNKEELIEVLRQFDEKRVEELPEKTRNIFYAIMKIADERDEYIHLYESTLKDLDIAVKNKIELENIRREAIEWIDKHDYYSGSSDIYYFSDFTPSNDLLNILNKGEKK